MSMQEQFTFSPLKGNRLRCNWNGEVIKASKSQQAYARAYDEFNGNGQVPAAKTPWSQPFSSSPMSRDRKKVMCPYAGCRITMNASFRGFLSAGLITCQRCGREFEMTEPLPMRIARVTGSWPQRIDVVCPYCERQDTHLSAGEKECWRCKQHYLVPQ